MLFEWALGEEFQFFITKLVLGSEFFFILLILFIYLKKMGNVKVTTKRKFVILYAYLTKS